MPGDIVHWPAGVDGHEHIGFFDSADVAVSHSDTMRVPHRHGLRLRDGRMPDYFLSRPAQSTLPLFVTGNAHKARLFERLLGLPIEHRKIDLEEIQSSDPKVIVEYKLRQAYSVVKQPVLVEDTSMGFEALSGLPGPFIKYFIESENGPEILCRMCDGFDNRRASATVTFGFFDGEQLEFFQNSISGEIAKTPGKLINGFGWDVVFIPDGYSGQLRSELNQDEYDETYARLKPIQAVREFLKGKQA